MGAATAQDGELREPARASGSASEAGRAGPPTGSLTAAIRADLRGSGPVQRVALVATVFWVAYEWGAGNEAVTPWLIAHTLSATSGTASIVAATAVGFGFTLVQQLASGFTALVGFSMFERTASAAWTRLSKRLQGRPARWSDLGLPSRTVLVFGLGTTAIVLVETVAGGTAGRQQHRATVVQSASLCALAVGLIAAVAGTLAYVGRQVDRLRGATDLVLRVLGNPLLWIGLVVVVLVVQHLRGRRAARAGEAS